MTPRHTCPVPSSTQEVRTAGQRPRPRNGNPGSRFATALVGAVAIALHSAGANDWSTIDAGFAAPPAEFRLSQYSAHLGAPVPVEQLAAAGVGGVQLFMQSDGYLQSEQAWANVSNNIAAVKDAGLRLWMADDNGYPSGMAGGRVVEADPAHEARCLIEVKLDGSGTGPVSLALPAGAEKFVHAHLYPLVNGQPDLTRPRAMTVQDGLVTGNGRSGAWTLRAFALQINNQGNQATGTAADFQTTGRYPNLLNPAAMEAFVSLTHEEYVRRFGPLGGQIDTFYSNEPNLMTSWFTNDPPTRPGGRSFLPWDAALPALFQQRHGYDLRPMLPALYGGTSTASKLVRRHFHETVGALLAQNFSQRLADWGDQNGVRFSGHPLQEEDLIYHVLNHGDMFRFVEPMQIPAVDLPMPDRGTAWNFWMPKLLSSVAQFKSRPAMVGLLDPIIYRPRMELTPLADDFRRIVNMGVFSGVNQFQTYLFWNLYEPAVYRGMSEYVGRLSLALRGARHASTVGLYYPIETFQANFVPSPHFWARGDLLTTEWQALNAIQNNLDITARDLSLAGIDFNWVHGDWLRDAVLDGGVLVVGPHRLSTIVLPCVEVLPLPVAEKLEQFRLAGGKVVLVESKPLLGDSASEHATVAALYASQPVVAAANLVAELGPVVPPDFELRVESPARQGTEQEFFVARFMRDGRRLTYLVNNATTAVTPALTLAGDVSRRVAVYNPLDGSITGRQLPGTLTIAPSSSLLVVENPASLPAEEFPSAPVLSVVNGNFADLTGLTNTTTIWFGGLPAGWSGGTSAAYAVVKLNGVAFANLGELAPGGQPNAITQLVGTNQVTSDIRLSFTLTNFVSSSSEVGVAFYGPGGVALGGTNVTAAGTYSHTVRGVAPGTAIRIALWGTSSSAPMGVTDVGVECYPTTSTLRWNGGLAGTWTNGGGGWIETTDGSAAKWNRPTPPTALFSNAASAAVTVAGNGVAAGGMRIAGGHWTFSGGSISNAGTWSVAAGTSADIRAGLAGSAGLTKQGGGRMILSGTNTYSAATVVEAGTLAWTGSLGSTSSLLVAEGAVVEADVSSPSSVAGHVVFSPGARLKVAGTPSAPAVRLLSAGGAISGTPVLDEAVPGYTLMTSANVVWLRANALSVANGSFEELSGLAVNSVAGQWRDGLPLGWSSETSTNAGTPTFSVFLGNGTASIANLSQLGQSGAFTPLYQKVGTMDAAGKVRVNFEIRNDWTPGTPVGVGAAIYQAGAGAVGTWPVLASGSYDSAGSRSLEADVAAGTPLAIAFWNWGGASTGLDNVALSVVENAPSGLSYAPDSMDAIVGTAVAPLGPPAVTGTVSNYSISPPLPPGLSINPSTGLISGTPSAASSRTSHTVTASNGGGSTTAAVTITVRSVFDGWTTGYGLDPAIDGAATADPDGDGRSNADEFAFGSNPVVGDASPTTATIEGDNFVVWWLARTDGAVAYTVEEREELAAGSWQPSSAAVQSGGGHLPPPGYEWRRASVAVNERMFLRIVASF